MDKILDFLQDKTHARKAKFVGFIAALCALFLGIPVPEVIEAKNALGGIQLFWLVVLTMSLTSIFLDLVKFVWQNERVVSKKYDIPSGSLITFFIGAILGGVILNLWVYTLTIYSEIFARFAISIGLPGGVVIGAILISILVQKHGGSFPSFLHIVIDSIIVGALLGIGGLYLQFAITKLFYPFWLYPVAPLTMLGFFILAVGLSIYRKENLFSIRRNETI